MARPYIGGTMAVLHRAGMAGVRACGHGPSPRGQGGAMRRYIGAHGGRHDTQVTVVNHLMIIYSNILLQCRKHMRLVLAIHTEPMSHIDAAAEHACGGATAGILKKLNR